MKGYPESVDLHAASSIDHFCGILDIDTSRDWLDTYRHARSLPEATTVLITIHCPECYSPLRVPDDAQGRSARCPLCRCKFQIPDLSGVMADTIVAWLHTDEQEPTPANPSTDRKGTSSLPSSKKQKKPDPATTSAGRSSDSRRNPRWVRKKVAAAKPTPVIPDIGAKISSGEASKSPRSLGSVGKSPRLIVKDVSTQGVCLSFDSRLLNHVAFRASMPLRCVVSGRCLHCGQSENDQLLARPLAWIDKATGHLADPRALEQRQEIRVHRQQRPCDVVGMMQPIEEFSTPFNNPMPYYVAVDWAAKAHLRCETVSSTQGIACELTIPSPAFALDWFARVNGVCNDQYARLEENLASLQATAWCTMPDNVRGRLAVWFNFNAGEQFIAYFNDADFTSRDAGMAGIVLTDQRMLYCRYHTHGDVYLDAPGSLLPIDHGAYVDLHYHEGERPRLMARLRPEEVEELRQTLREMGALLPMRTVVPAPATK